jgi:membrane protein DedA with SNARE-associated domain
MRQPLFGTKSKTRTTEREFKMQEWVIQIMDQYGYLGISALIAIENLFPPIPSELILTFGGFMTTYTSIWIVALSATIGSVVGAIILYGVGRVLPAEKMDRFLGGKWGRALGFKKGDVARANSWFSRRGTSTVFFCRFIPLVRSLISIPAGMSRMRKGRFLFYTAAGSAIWNVVLVTLGAFAGAGWEHVSQSMNLYTYIALAVMAVAGVILALRLLKKRRAKK